MRRWPRTCTRRGMRLPKSSRSKLCFFVDPLLERQLDPRGVALLRRAPGGGGLLAVSSVCDDPDCESRDVQVWVVPFTKDLVAGEVHASGRVELWEQPPSDGAPPFRAGTSELYALVDVDSGTVTAHPAHGLDLAARRLLAALRKEMDPELRAYFRRRFEDVRQLARGRPRGRERRRRVGNGRLH
jgi:hypothetical protein